MTPSDLPAEEQRVCGLVREEASRCLAAERRFSLYLVGSRATSEAWPTSDFDFVINAEEPLPGKVINPLARPWSSPACPTRSISWTGIAAPRRFGRWRGRSGWVW